MQPPNAMVLLYDVVRIGRRCYATLRHDFKADDIFPLVIPIGWTAPARYMHRSAIKNALACNNLIGALDHACLEAKGPDTPLARKIRMVMRYAATADAAIALYDFWHVLATSKRSYNRFDALMDLGLQKPGECSCALSVIENGTLARRWAHQNHWYFNKICWDVIQSLDPALHLLRKHTPRGHALHSFLQTMPDPRWFSPTAK